MKKYRAGDTAQGTVCDLGMNGEGVVKDGAYPIFVPRALEGEVISYRITLAKRDYAFGELIEVLSPSNDRVKPKCRYFGRCGGCDLQHMSHLRQLELKRDNIRAAFAKIAHMEPYISPVLSLNEWGYRNKLSLPFGVMGRGGKVIVGFYEKLSHRVVPLKECPLHGRWAARLIADVTEWANENRVSVYDERTGKGLLRHLVCRKLDSPAIVLVINGDSLPRVNNLIKKLDRHFDDYTLYISINKTGSNVIMGDSVALVHGTETPQKLGNFSAKVSPMSFLQINDAIRDAIYDAVCEELTAGLKPLHVTELYSGVGILTAQLAFRLAGTRFTAVEIVPEAVRDANALAKILSLSDRIENICSDAAEYLNSIKNTAEEMAEERALVLDPPRKGCDRTVLEAAVKAGFGKIIYISCNPATLARDVEILSACGYILQNLRPYDMFPQTMHVETVAVLVLQS